MARVSETVKQEGRQRLLQTAAQHFARHGFDRANVNTIAREAGFAKGSLYNYFRSKEDLFGEVVTEACRRAAERYSTCDPGDSVRARLTALTRADVSVLIEEEPFLKVLIREAMSFRTEVYPVILEHLAPFFRLVQRVLEDGVARREIRCDLPVSQLALLFVGLLSVSYVQHWGSGGVWPTLAGVPDLVVTAFLDGAGLPGSGSPEAATGTEVHP